MTVLLTATARVADWRALQRLHGETLVARARDAGASRYRVYRNMRNAAQLLVVAELPDDEAAGELARALEEHLGAALLDEAADDRVWEAAACEGIG